MTNLKKWTVNILILVISIGLTFYFVFRGESFSEVIGLIKTADLRWCFIGVICVLIFILGESVIMWFLVGSISKKERITHFFLYSFVGFFFSAITPSASGGQPMQAYFMKKDKIPLSVSAPVLAFVTVLYKGVLVAVGAVVLAVRPKKIMYYLEPCIFWCKLGLFLNVIFVTALMLFIFKPELVRKTANKCVGLCKTIFHFKKADEINVRVDEWCDRYAGVIECFGKSKKTIAVAFIMTVFQRFALFSVTWFCCLAFNVAGGMAVSIVILQAMISEAVDMLPFPGGTGISESLFISIFKPILGNVLYTPIMVLSRGISYYVQMILGGIFTLVAMLTIGRTKKERMI